MQTPTQPISPLPTPTVPGLGDYIFGPPQVVLTHTSAMGIAGWLPDSEHLLLTRLVPTDTNREYIETFNIRTRELRQYGERYTGGPKPLWLETIQKVAFTNRASLQPVSYDLWVSGCDAAQARQPIRQGITLWSVGGGGNVIAFVPQGQRQLLWVDDSGRPVNRPSVDLGVLGFVPTDETTVFSVVLSPDGRKLALYNRLSFLIVNALTGTLERVIDLGYGRGEYVGYKTWPLDARWSSDGRYIAMRTTVGQPLYPYTDLIVLDMNTGALRRIELRSQYLLSLAWAPNGRVLVTLTRESVQQGRSLESLYLVDVLSGEIHRMLPDHQFIGSASWGLGWSPSEQTIAVACSVWHEAKPLITEGRLCLISS